MSVSVSMPQLGESVTEGTVTRWLKREGEHVQADEPLLEVSTDKVDTEIPSPVSGVLRGITVAEDETVAVGAELAVIDEDGAGRPAGRRAAGRRAPGRRARRPPRNRRLRPSRRPRRHRRPPAAGRPRRPQQAPVAAQAAARAGSRAQAAAYAPPPRTTSRRRRRATSPSRPPSSKQRHRRLATSRRPARPAENGSGSFTDGADGPYVTPLVRKLAAEHGIDLAAISGTGVGGRIRKQDILDAARVARGPESGTAAGPAGRRAAVRAGSRAAPRRRPRRRRGTSRSAGRRLAAEPSAPAPRRSTIVPSSLRGTTERMSRARQVIAQRMVESLQVSAQLTTVVEADVTAIARLRQRAKAAFEAREGVKLSFLPFFALAAVEALKVHPKLNAVIDTASGQVTYHDAEHLGIAVDTERGLMVPVIRNAGDLNIGGLARKIADLAERTRPARSARTTWRAAPSRSPTPAAAARCSTRRSSTSRRSASSAPAPW